MRDFFLTLLIAVGLAGCGENTSASRLVRKVLALVGHPVLRMTAFQVPAGGLTIVAI